MPRQDETVSALDHVTVSGPDAKAFLQGQLTQDVDALAVGGDTWTFVLEPDGHVIALAALTRTGDDTYRLAVAEGLGVRVEARLRKFLLRTKAEIVVTERAAEDADERTRIEQGRLGAADLDERTVPAETGWVAAAVSFTKGCYTGQELVARMDSRVAEPPRRLVRLVGSAPLAAGAPLVRDGVEIGAVTSAAGDVALGYVKRGVALEGDLVAGGVAARIDGVVGA